MEYWNDGFLEVILQYSNTPICLLAEVHMKRSTERILVTHAGTLPQPKDLKEMLDAKNEGKPYDHEAYSRRVRSAVAEGVRNRSIAVSISSTMANWANPISRAIRASG